MDVFLQTSRLRLRRFTTVDADNLVALDGDPEVMRYLTNGKPTTREAIENQVLPSILRCYEQSDAGRWAAEDLASGEFLGWLSLQPPTDGSTKELDLGCRLLRSAWGRGYATEGARALIRKAFTSLGTQRVFAQTMAVNTRSRRVMERQASATCAPSTSNGTTRSPAPSTARSNTNFSARTGSGRSRPHPAPPRQANDGSEFPPVQAKPDRSIRSPETD